MLAALRKVLSLDAAATSPDISATQAASQSGAWLKLERDSWSEGATLEARLISEVAAAEEKLLLLLRWGLLDAVNPFLKMSHLKTQHFAIRTQLYQQVAGLCREHHNQCRRRLAGDETVTISLAPPLNQLSQDATTHRIRVRLKHCNSALESLASSVAKDTAAFTAAAGSDEPVQIAHQLHMQPPPGATVQLVFDGAAPPTPSDAGIALTGMEHRALTQACGYLAVAQEAVAAREAHDRSQLSDSLYIRSSETCHLEPRVVAHWLCLASNAPDGPVSLHEVPLAVHTQHQANASAMNIVLNNSGSGDWQHKIVLSSDTVDTMRDWIVQRTKLRARVASVFMDRRCQWGKLVAAWCRRVLGYDPISAAWWARVQAVLRIDTARTGVKLPAAYEAAGEAQRSPSLDSPAARPRAGSSSAVPDMHTTAAASEASVQRRLGLPVPRIRGRLRKSSSPSTSLREVHLQAAAWGMFHAGIIKQLGCDMKGLPNSNSLPRPKLVNAFAKWLSSEIAREAGPSIQAILQRSPDTVSAKEWSQAHLLPAVQWEIFSRLHAVLFSTGQVQWMPAASSGFARIRAADSRWRRKAPVIARLTPEHLGVKPTILSPGAFQDSGLFALPRCLLAVSETLMSPDDMLSCMCCAVECMLVELRLRNGGQDVAVTADDLAPLLMCLLSRSCMSQPHAAMAFVGTYALGGTAAHATGQRGYILISLQMAISAVVQHREDTPAGAASDSEEVELATGITTDQAEPGEVTADNMDADEALIRLGSGRLEQAAAAVELVGSAGGGGGADAEDAEVSVWEALGAQVRGGEAAGADREGIQEMGEWIGDHKVVQETLVLFS